MKDAAKSRSNTLALSLFLTIYFAARILEVLPGSTHSVALVAMDVVSAMIFGMILGAIHYGWRGILVFSGICIVVGNVVENLGVATGFPYGNYVFLTLMGPKLFHVPILLGLAYIGMAYVSWTLARIILGGARQSERGARIISQALATSFIMVAWDLAQDPVWSTLLHGWRWFDGGAWFGVPLSNYAGWFGTIFLISILFGLYLRRLQPEISAKQSHPRWRFAIAFYALCAVGNVLQVIPMKAGDFVTDPSGANWSARGITLASALVSIFVMGAFAVLAWLRSADCARSGG